MDIIRVLIADDHLEARAGFTKLLSLFEWIDIVGEATSAQSVADQAIALQPDVVLLDLVWYKDRTSGIAAITQLKSRVPHVKVLAITAYTELITEARLYGADIAIDREAVGSAEYLADRIQDAYRMGNFAPPISDLVERLTERELDVLELVGEHTDAEIGQILVIAESTVKNHLTSINGKLGTSRRAGAVQRAFELGLLPRRK